MTDLLTGLAGLLVLALPCLVGGTVCFLATVLAVSAIALVRPSWQPTAQYLRGLAWQGVRRLLRLLGWLTRWTVIYLGLSAVCGGLLLLVAGWRDAPDLGGWTGYAVLGVGFVGGMILAAGALFVVAGLRLVAGMRLAVAGFRRGGTVPAHSDSATLAAVRASGVTVRAALEEQATRPQVTADGALEWMTDPAVLAAAQQVLRALDPPAARPVLLPDPSRPAPVRRGTGPTDCPDCGRRVPVVSDGTLGGHYQPGPDGDYCRLSGTLA